MRLNYCNTKKIFHISFLILLLVSDLYSQNGYSVPNVPAGSSFVLKLKNSIDKRHTFSLGPGITNKGFAAFGIGYKFETFKNFRIGLSIEVFGARVNNGANAGGFLLTGITPEYRVLSYNKFSIGVSAGLGFVLGMYPLYCISPGVNFEYKLGKLVSLSLEPEYLIFQQKEARELNSIVLTKLNINFNF